MEERWKKTELTFEASHQTVRVGVNEEVSGKHAVFTLLLTLNRGGRGERGRQREVIMGFEGKWQKEICRAKRLNEIITQVERETG